MRIYSTKFYQYGIGNTIQILKDIYQYVALRGKKKS